MSLSVAEQVEEHIPVSERYRMRRESEWEMHALEWLRDRLSRAVTSPVTHSRSDADMATIAQDVLQYDIEVLQKRVVSASKLLALQIEKAEAAQKVIPPLLRLQ